ncbi:hypothetical protein, partial [Staphylococcus pettenkoferi]|uniref:hypothetical protein n=1 Tax=Staphylococcus pettenkoferi TaxID=170573 RepID=UPI001C92BD6E
EKVIRRMVRVGRVFVVGLMSEGKGIKEDGDVKGGGDGRGGGWKKVADKWVEFKEGVVDKCGEGKE